MSMTATTAPVTIDGTIQHVAPSREDIFGEATMRLNELIIRDSKTMSPDDVVNFIDDLMLDFKMKLDDMPRFCSWYRKEALRRKKHSKESNLHFVTRHIINSIDHCRELGDWQMDK